MSNILAIRGHRVLLDSDLAALYQVETKALTRAVRRNMLRGIDRFLDLADLRQHLALYYSHTGRPSARARVQLARPRRD